MFDDLGNGQATNYILAIGIVAVALLALFFVFWLIRKRSNSTFIRGGKNRQPRLAVLDAAAVDTRRRLVLVRRDGVEHLILIGGPTDVVIESGIVRPEQEAAMPGAQEAALPIATSEDYGQPRREQPIQQPNAPVAGPQPSVTPSRPARPVSPITPSRAPDSIAAAALTTTAAAAAVPPKDAAENALDALDAARDRVLSTPDTVPSQPIHPASSAAASQPASEKPAVEKPAATIADAYFEDDTAPIGASQPEAAPVSQPLSNFSKPVAPTPATSATVSARQMPVQPTQNPQRPAMTDFEAILEAELAEDFEIGDNLGIDISKSAADIDTGGDLSGVAPGHHQRDGTAIPAKRDDSRTNTLEDEMDKLLGDLSRRNGSS